LLLNKNKYTLIIKFKNTRLCKERKKREKKRKKKESKRIHIYRQKCQEINDMIRKLGITIYIRMHLYLNKSIAYRSAQDRNNWWSEVRDVSQHPQLIGFHDISPLVSST
jgi:hypothetical protein